MITRTSSSGFVRSFGRLFAEEFVEFEAEPLASRSARSLALSVVCRFSKFGSSTAVTSTVVLSSLTASAFWADDDSRFVGF